MTEQDSLTQVILRRAEENKDIIALSELAKVIWKEHYSAILIPAQIDYMLENFQSPEAIKNQINNEGYEYFFITKDDKTIGYTAILKKDHKLFISKLYILKEERSKGYGRRTFSILEKMARDEEYSSLWLTVNRYNEASINAYKKNGFDIIRSQVTDIEGGFVMDDYVMEKVIQS
jgi:ribosomal protein S18 acetylase RimI-like enzyme